MRRRRQQRGRPAQFLRHLVLLVAVFSLLGVAWLLPTLLLSGPLKIPLLKAVIGNADATVTAGPVSAGWFSPLVVQDLRVTDAHGEQLVHVASIQTEKPLAQILVQRRQPGQVRFHRPHLQLELRADGSNLEDFLQPWFAADESTAGVDCTIDVVAGQVDVHDVARNAHWSLADVNLSCDITAQSPLPSRAQLTAAVTSPGGHAGQISAELGPPPAGDGNAPSTAPGSINLQTVAVPLSLLEPLARRFEPGIRLNGQVSGSLQARWAAEETSVELRSVELRRFSLQAPSVIGADQLASAEVHLHGVLRSSGTGWQIDGLTLTSDLLHFQADGRGTVSDSQRGLQWLAHAWRRGDFQAEGTVDLARLAEALPETLRIRQGTTVSAGQVAFSLRGTPRGRAQQWEAQLTTDQLAALHQQQPIVWDEPIEIAVRAQQQDGVIQVDQLTCRASFLQVAGQGTVQDGGVRIVGDLSQFTAEMQRFFHLGDLRLAGQVRGDLRWQQDAQGELELHGDMAAERFEFASAQGTPWREAKLTITLAAQGRAESSGLLRIDSAALALSSDGDRFQAQLLEPVDLTSQSTAWPCSFRLAGDLQSWLARLQGVIKLPAAKLAGRVACEGQAIVGQDQIDLQAVSVNAQDFELIAPGLTIREPEVELATTATWLRDRRELRSPTTTLASSSLSLRVDDVRANFQADSAGANGRLGIRGDLRRLHSWFQGGTQLPTHRFAGHATGRLQLSQQQGTTSAEWNLEINDFAIDHRDPAHQENQDVAPQVSWQTVWQEPSLRLAGRALYDRSRDQVELDSIQVVGQSLNLGAAGTVGQPWTRAQTNLQGQIGYDSQTLTRWLQAYLGDSLRLVGRETATFAFQGPLLPAWRNQTSPRVQQVSQLSHDGQQHLFADMFAEARMAWTSASVSGFEIGAGELNTKLAEGVLQVAPLDLSVGEGTARLEPRVDLTGPTPRLAGRAELNEILVTADMCRSWLKYVAPLLADATAAQGKISAAVDDANIPLNRPQAGQFNGVLAIDSAQVGAGPMVQQLLVLAQQLKVILNSRNASAASPVSNRWLVLPRQQVAFRLADERIYHQSIRFIVQDVEIRTTGSVGLDQSLSLMAEVPIREEWAAANRYLASLRGRVLKIPIHGTLSQPQLDSSAIKQLTAQLVTESAAGAATQLLERLFD